MLPVRVCLLRWHRKAKVDASHKVKSISAINDRLVPKDENDRSVPYYHWWPKQGTTEWISYEFPSEATVSSATVYWYDDAPWEDAAYRKVGRCTIKMHKASGNR